ncbi:MAG: hypothetical protein WAW79_09355 [Steroidobacteraceae bacterium]
MTTIPFGRGPQKDPLLAQASSLPTEIAPPRDLWPAISARIAEHARAAPRRFSWPLALAAGFLIASVSALLTWGLMRDPGPAPGENRLAGATVIEAAPMPVNYGPNSALGASQLKSRDELLVLFRQRLEQLPPQTRATVVRNLEIIQRAADEIDAALAQDPASGLLNGLLLSTYREELKIYAQVVASGDDLMRRT